MPSGLRTGLNCVRRSVLSLCHGDRYTVDVGPYKSTHRFCEEKTDVVDGCRKRTLNERVNGWLVKMASVEVTLSYFLKAKFHYAGCFEAGRRQVRSQIPLRYLVRSWSATTFEPAIVMEFGFNDSPVFTTRNELRMGSAFGAVCDVFVCA